MAHTHETPSHTSLDTARTWDEVYRGGRKWSGRPNQFLVPAVGDEHTREGATALDLGCGEGGDAIWLAQRGWDVLGVDVSVIALERARAHADASGVAVRFEHSDLDSDFPEGKFDLVTASYLHSMIPFERDRILRRGWSAVAPGGRLVILSHAAFPAGHEHGGTPLPDPAETIALLELPAEASWRASAEYVSRPMTMPDGSTWHRLDHVVLVQRLL